MSRKGTKDNRSYGRLELPEALRRKEAGNKRAEHFDRSGKKHLRGFSSTRLNRKCSVPPAGNFLPSQIKTVHFLPEAKLFTLETLKHMQAIVNTKHALQQNSRGSNRKEVQGTLFNVCDMLSDTEEKMKKLINISYFIAKHEPPFSDFEDFCKLHVKNGLSLGETYIKDKGCRVFVEAIEYSIC